MFSEVFVHREVSVSGTMFLLGEVSLTDTPIPQDRDPLPLTETPLPWTETPPPLDRDTLPSMVKSSRYASSWNAFLFLLSVVKSFTKTSKKECKDVPILILNKSKWYSVGGFRNQNRSAFDSLYFMNFFFFFLPFANCDIDLNVTLF